MYLSLNNNQFYFIVLFSICLVGAIRQTENNWKITVWTQGEQELPEDNEARRLEMVWGKGQSHRGQNDDLHGKDLSLGICVIYINGVTRWVYE